jgi:hypothetical protein
MSVLGLVWIYMMRVSRYVDCSVRRVPDAYNIQAMRFPMNQHRLELKNAQEARERERELAKEIVEGEMDDDDAGGDFEGM